MGKMNWPCEKIRYSQQKIMKQIKFTLLIIAVLMSGVTGCRTNSVKDIEGNEYNTVTIGTQIWMAENLETTKLNDGTEIPNVVDNEAWGTLQTPALSWYNNDPAGNKNTYGALYNWHAVNTNKLCPAGWHVPTEGDWTSLNIFLDGPGSIGGKLKEAGTSHWKSPNTDATNESGFTGLPGGYRSFEGIFNYLRISGYWWSSTPYNESSILFWYLRYKGGNLFRYRSEIYCGFSVRCVRDN